jgi:uncharacterized Rmd1/YagE family protein
MLEIAGSSRGAQSEAVGQTLTVRALLVGDRLNPAGLESRDMVSTTPPVAFRLHASGLVVLFRYGVVVMIGLGPDEQTSFMAAITPRIIREFPRYEEELAQVQICDDTGEAVQPGGRFVYNHSLMIGFWWQRMRWPRALSFLMTSAGCQQSLM